MKITSGIIDIAIQQLIPIKNKKARPQLAMVPEFVTIHNTASAGATAKQNADYVVNQNEYKSWHFTVGNGEIYQHLPVTEIGYHAGDVDGNGNMKSIGIEIAEVYGADRTAVKFIAELIKILDIPIENVFPHKHWSGKNCPRLIMPYWNDFINDIKRELDDQDAVTYVTYGSRIHELKGSPLKLNAKIVDKKIRAITEHTNCVNGTFFWHDDKGKTYPTSPLVIDGTVHQRFCNHEKPQSVFVIYKNGKVKLQRVEDVYEIPEFYNIKLAIGGIGLRNTDDVTFRYDPTAEGFSGKYADVLAKRNKTVLGYSKTHNKVYLLAVENATHAELIKIISDNSTGEAYDIAISLDGGGSTFMDAQNKYVFKGDNLRRINNIVGFF